MEASRRRWLQGLGLAWASVLAPPVVFAAPDPARRPLAALLLPLSGASADLARSMAQAAALAQGAATAKTVLPVFDTGGTPEGAARAATAALKAGVPLLLGPLFGREIAAVAAVAGGVPVLAFSNDLAAPRGAAFLLGVTAAQAVEAVLGYARRRGVRRVAVVADASGWGGQGAAAARAVAGDIGIELTATTFEALRGMAPDALPDAVLVTGGGPALGAAARELKAAGVQLLATLQATEATPAGLAALDGAWCAAPDPERFAEFARTYEARHGATPGVLAGLAYDAVGIARAMRAAGLSTREGLLRTSGFGGATGTVRFARDGSAARDLAVLVAEGGTLRVVERSSA